MPRNYTPDDQVEAEIERLTRSDASGIRTNRP